MHEGNEFHPPTRVLDCARCLRRFSYWLFPSWQVIRLLSQACTPSSLQTPIGLSCWSLSAWLWTELGSFPRESCLCESIQCASVQGHFTGSSLGSLRNQSLGSCSTSLHLQTSLSLLITKCSCWSPSLNSSECSFVFKSWFQIGCRSCCEIENYFDFSYLSSV